MSCVHTLKDYDINKAPYRVDHNEKHFSHLVKSTLLNINCFWSNACDQHSYSYPPSKFEQNHHGANRMCRADDKNRKTKEETWKNLVYFIP